MRDGCDRLSAVSSPGRQASKCCCSLLTLCCNLERVFFGSRIFQRLPKNALARAHVFLPHRQRDRLQFSFRAATISASMISKRSSHGQKNSGLRTGEAVLGTSLCVRPEENVRIDE